MRDILITLIIFGAIPYIISRTYIGVLAWSWLSYMSPHRLAYGFAYNFPFSQVVALVTVFSLLINKEKKKFIWNPLTMFWILFVVWVTVSSIFSLNPTDVWWEWQRTIKIQLFTFITVLVVTEKKRINALVAIIAFSLGFFGIKGGAFSILTGGNFLVFGPPDSFVEDNNALALALVMIIPLMYYLFTEYKNRYVRLAIIGSIGLCTVSIITSYSRGALLAISAMTLYLWFKSKYKLRTAIILLIFAPVLFSMMPESWFDRMNTIQTYEEDGSALGRINAWYFAYNLALDNPLTGGGFQTFTKALFLQYAPEPLDHHDAHSIYFEVLGEHGFVGLILFLLVGVYSLLTARSVIKSAKKYKELEWVVNLASMLQVSMIGYAVGGAFLGLAYYDLYWHLVALVVILKIYMRDYTVNENPGVQKPLVRQDR